jgi:hypothetical protein
MTALVRLYPRSWRDRYEPEFLALLEARPPSVRDRMDIVRGAVDARLDGGSPRESTRLTWLAAICAIVGGALWVAWLVVSIRGFDAIDPPPDHDLGRLLSLLAGLGLAAGHLAIGLASVDRMRPWGGIAAAIQTIGFGITAFGGGGDAVFALAGSIGLATAVAGRTLPQSIGALWVAATLGVFGALIGLVASDWSDPSVMDAAIPYGFVWILTGLTVALRGVPVVVVDGERSGTEG